LTLAQHQSHENASGASHGIGRYILVWVTLLVFTVITVITGRIDLGAANIYIAMIIALTKATLVVLFFMHLYDEGGVNRLVFIVSVLFLVVLLLGVFADLMWRLPISLPNEGPLPTLPKGSLGSSHAPH
jgi:cytochrome c oxidase subunit IV